MGNTQASSVLEGNQRAVSDDAKARALYLDLMKACLTRTLFGERYRPILPSRATFALAVVAPILHLLGRSHYRLVREVSFDAEVRADGRDWPAEAETMIGLWRLNDLQRCLAETIERQVAGDVIEAGVWRGGATIFMRAVLKAYGERHRTVWVADSFRGLPKANPRRSPSDAAIALHRYPELAIPLETVKRNFARYGLLDECVRFLPGWFSETLPSAPISELALIRVDCDHYESTMDALNALYPKLTPRGYLIVDDYGSVPGCRRAVDEFRSACGIHEPLSEGAGGSAIWQRAG